MAEGHQRRSDSDASAAGISITATNAAWDARGGFLVPEVTRGDRRGEAAAELLAQAPHSLHVLDVLEPGGAQNVVLSLAEWLRTQGAPVTVVGPPGPLVDSLPPGVRFEPIRPGPLALVDLDRTVRAVRPDVLHAHQRRQALDALGVGMLHGIPVVEHAHTAVPDRRFRAVSYRSRVVFAVGDNVKRMIVDEFGRHPDAVRVIGNVPAISDDDPVPSEPPRPGEPLRILAAGRLMPQKDPLRFIRVISELNRLTPTTARWVGDGPLRSDAVAAAAALGAPVEFPGHSRAMTEEIDRCHALVMTSRWEGLPLIGLEAQLRLRPVIATAASAVLRPVSARGLVADDADDASFARTIVATLRSPELRAELPQARSHIREHLTPARVYGPVLAAYRELVRDAR